MIGVLCAASVVLTGVALRAARRSGTAMKVRRRLGVALRPPGHSPGWSNGPEPPAWLAGALVRAGYENVEPHRVWRLWLPAATAFSGVTAIVAGPAVAVLVMALALILPGLALWVMRARGERRLEAGLPVLLEGVAASLRAGTSLPQALTAAAADTPGTLGVELTAVVAVAGQGSPLPVELDRWSGRRSAPGLRLAVAALALGADTGGPHARALDAVASTLRDREAVRREVAALSSQARASAVVMVVAPLVFAVVASLLDPRVGHVLVATPIGLACLAGGLLLDATAGAWMLHITGGDP